MLAFGGNRLTWYSEAVLSAFENLVDQVYLPAAGIKQADPGKRLPGNAELDGDGIACDFRG